MDFLDPRHVRRHTIMLFLGYGLIAIAIVATALVLLYQSSGFGITKDGEVIQNGLVFAASTPDGARIRIDGQENSFQTNKRLFLVAGDYTLEYNKNGYTPWTHTVHVEGGKVSRPDYAFLFPSTLETATLGSFNEQPIFSTQSPDRRWLLVLLGDGSRNFDLYDLEDLEQAPKTLALPEDIATAGKKEAWELAEWSTDNRHVLLKHTVDKSVEFILVDRQDPTKSLNLNTLLQTDPTEIKLRDKKYDQYYLYDAKKATLQTATISQPTPLAFLQHVMAYKPYGRNRMLYVTDIVKQTTPTDTRYAVMLADGNKTYQIRRITPGKKYQLEMAGYNSNMYIAAGVDTEKRVVVYKNPLDQINDRNLGIAVQVATLKVPGANFIEFSASARYVAVENGSHFGVYDAEENKVYNYNLSKQLDAAASHASWMDGNRLTFPSDGTLYVFDADHTNSRALMPVNAAYAPAFTPDYQRVLTIAPAKTKGAQELQRTWLRIAADR
jgi:hypothetical protein